MKNEDIGRKKVIFIVGPTAIGKTRVSIELADRLNSEIIGADSRQVYREMDIGTAKPKKEDLRGIKHHMIDIVNPDEPFNVGMFKQMADEIINNLIGKDQIPIIVGGTGLYIRALRSGLWNGPSCDIDYRNKLREEEEISGKGYLYEKLKSVDPELADKIHPNDLVKIIRGLEVYHLTKIPLSASHRSHMFAETPYNEIVIGLRMDRKRLYERIESRIDNMINEGFIDEVKRLLEKGYKGDLSSMQGLGYKQFTGYLRGSYDLPEATSLLKRDTKRYAKRQFTWFNKEKEVLWLDLDERDNVSDLASNIEEIVSN